MPPGQFNVIQPAISQQLPSAPDLASLHPRVLLDAAAPTLKALAEQHGYSRLAVFGSVARGEASAESDIDLLVTAPPGTSSFGFGSFTMLLEQVLGCEIDLVEYGGLRLGLDDDIHREVVPL